ncbi:hypothetical protein [Dyadobacter sp. 676]|uniref:DUF4345 domain-containing protein n=1 Tax=Dyadobacter sp. 676 TaxID=3088362 RepID=A0AAU8FEP3_9BACT
MKAKKSSKITLSVIMAVQGCYYLVTGFWPIIHLRSFMWATGDKTDIWLVKMVGLLSGAIGATLLLSKKSGKRTGTALGIFSALAFAVIDIYYAASEVISPVYLYDAALQLIFVAFYLLRQNAR